MIINVGVGDVSVNWSTDSIWYNCAKSVCVFSFGSNSKAISIQPVCSPLACKDSSEWIVLYTKLRPQSSEGGMMSPVLR